MKFFTSRWRPRHLLLAWISYWIALIVVTLWPVLSAGWRVSRPNAHGSINAGITNGTLTATFAESGRAIWTGSTSLTTAGLLIALPPLLLWLIWLATSARTNNADEIAPKNHRRERELIASDQTPGMTESFSQTSIRQQRGDS